MKKADNILVFIVSIIIVFVSYKYGFAIGSTFALGLANLVVLLIYTKETKLMRKESQLMREAQTEPHISISFESASTTSTGIKNLVIKNDGMGNAYRIKINLLTNIDVNYVISEMKLKDLSVFNKIIPQVVKEQKISFLFINPYQDKSFFEYKEVILEVIYFDEKEKEYRNKYDISLSYTESLAYTDNLMPIDKFFNWQPSSGGNKLVDNLSKINRSILELKESIENKIDIDEE